MYNVKQQDKTLFSGTLVQCWDFLVEEFKDNTVKLLIELKVRIE